MLIIIGLTLFLCLATAAAAVIYVRAHKQQTFPPVVELAHTSALPRLGFKIASLTARDTVEAPAPPVAPPPVPFATVTRPGNLPATPLAPRVPPHPRVDPMLPVPPVLTSPAQPAAPQPPAQVPVVSAPQPEVAPSTKSVYEVRTGPYAAPIVKGARISLPDDEEVDLPIVFRSAHPAAQPIVEAGDTAERVQITGTDGRIRVNEDGPISFGPPAD